MYLITVILVITITHQISQKIMVLFTVVSKQKKEKMFILVVVYLNHLQQKDHLAATIIILSTLTAMNYQIKYFKMVILAVVVRMYCQIANLIGKIPLIADYQTGNSQQDFVMLMLILRVAIFKIIHLVVAVTPTVVVVPTVVVAPTVVAIDYFQIIHLFVDLTIVQRG